MDKKLLLLLNPNAGQRRANRYLPEIIRLYNSCGYDCTVFVTAAAGDAEQYILNSTCEYDRVVCIGGDGTLNETTAGIARKNSTSPMGYIPAGTTNDYAASLGLSGEIMTAAQDSVEGTIVPLDIGTFNGKYFNYTASCGAFAKASYSTPQAAKNAIGHLAYIMEGIMDIPNIHPISMQIETDNRKIEDQFIFCSITNSLSVGGILKIDPKLISMNDGSFEVMLIRYPKTPAALTKIITALTNFDLPNDLIEFFPVRRLKIISSDYLEWTVDGECGAKGYEFEAEVLEKKINMVIPKSAAMRMPAEISHQK